MITDVGDKTIMVDIIQNHIGEFAALTTAFCWALNAIAFETAAKKVGSLAVSYIRLLIALIPLSITTLIINGQLFPLDVCASTWLWLSLAGFAGFAVGDFFIFEAYVLIGSRTTRAIASTSPPMAALAGFLLMGEKLTLANLGGMLLIMLGVTLVVMRGGKDRNKVRTKLPIKGLVYAVLGSLGQALSFTFGKFGVQFCNPFSASQIRLIAALVAYTIAILIRGKSKEIGNAFCHFKSVGQIAIGAILGPFIGVTLSLIASQYIATGVVSSLTSLSSVFIIPLSVLIFNDKVSFREITGVGLSVVGIALLFL